MRAALTPKSLRPRREEERKSMRLPEPDAVPEPDRIVLLVQSEIGYRNLMALTSHAFLDGEAGADAEHEIGDRAVGRRQKLCLLKLPLQIGDFGADRRDCGLMQGQHLLRFRYRGLCIGQSRLRLLLLRS